MQFKPSDHKTKNNIEPTRWVLAIVVIKSIILSSYVALPIGLGIFTFLFNVAQGKLIEGIIVGLFAGCVMVFLMQIAMVRNLREEERLDLFIRTEIRISAFSRWLISITSSVNKQ